MAFVSKSGSSFPPCEMVTNPPMCCWVTFRLDSGCSCVSDLSGGRHQPRGGRGVGAGAGRPLRTGSFRTDPVLPCFAVHAFSVGRPPGSRGRNPRPRGRPTVFWWAAGRRVLRLALRGRASRSRLRGQLCQVVGLSPRKDRAPVCPRRPTQGPVRGPYSPGPFAGGCEQPAVLGWAHSVPAPAPHPSWTAVSTEGG